MISRFYISAGFFLICIIVIALSGCAPATDRPAPVLNMGQKNTAAGVAIVQMNDTVSHIAKRFNLPMRDIIALNRIDPPYTIYQGQRLKLPPPRLYKVKSGDTLYEISRMFGTDMRSVAKLNNMRSPYTIHVGDNLRMPSPSRTFASNSGAAPKKASASSARAVKRALKVPERARAGKFLLPVQGEIISSYGPKKGGLHNDGVNIKVPYGTGVKAAENGVVAYTGDDIEGYGNLILIRHTDGYMTAYAHLSEFAVKRGDQVSRGQRIGRVGATGNVDRPQLHFEIRKGRKALNPQPLI